MELIYLGRNYTITMTKKVKESEVRKEEHLGKGHHNRLRDIFLVEDITKDLPKTITHAQPLSIGIGLSSSPGAWQHPPHLNHFFCEHISC